MIKILQITKYFFIIFCVLCSVFFKKAIASDYLFDEEFNTRNDNLWNFINNGGSIDISSGILTLNSTGVEFPVVYSKFEPIFSYTADSTFEVRFKYNNYGSMGDGISIGFTGSTNYPFYEFSLWRDAGAQFVFNNFNTIDFGNCNPTVDRSDLKGTRVPTNISLDNGWHILKIKRYYTSYLVYLDEETNKQPIFSVYGDECLPKNIILGNPLSAGKVDWNSLSIDYIRVYYSDDPPSPTPILLQKKKIIIIPGLGASWNTRAMVYNDTAPDLNWQMTPFVNNYQGLIDTLKNGGLHEGEDYYVWNYDWRKPVAKIVENLNDFVNKNIGVDEKVDLVGHSLGGLTARIWAQTHSDDSRLDKVIALGGPQRGSVEAYDAWNGASLPEGDLVENVALNVLSELQRKNNITKVETLRNYAPVLKDLIPTFDFVKKNGSPIKATALKSVNSYLADVNNNISSLQENIKAVVGTGVQTKKWINLETTNIFNQILGYWPDGEPVSFEKGDGDGTVLTSSATLGQNINMLSKHGELVSGGTVAILNELGLNGLTPIAENNVDLNGKLLFYIGSPAYLNVNCGGGITAVSDDLGFALVDGSKSMVCKVNIIGTDNGTYHLVTGKVGDDSSWHYFENEIGIGKSEVISIDTVNGDITENQNSDYWYKLILRDINLLINQYPKDKSLGLAKSAAEKKNVGLLMEKIFGFRNGSKETTVTGRIIDNLREILILNNRKPNKNAENAAWKLAKKETDIIDKLTTKFVKNGWKPTEFAAINYQNILTLKKYGDSALARGDIKELSADTTLLWQFVVHFW